MSLKHTSRLLPCCLSHAAGGSDVLMDQIVIAWGFLRGTFGIEPTLSGLDIVHPPAKQLEGAVWSFVHLGTERTATVTNGKVVLST